MDKNNNKNKLNQWLNSNKELVQNYRNKYIAFSSNDIIANGTSLDDVLKQAEQSNEYFAIYFVPKYFGKGIKILPIRLKTISQHDWIPNYLVTLKHKDKKINSMMLVDSGADFSVISNKSGIDLGFKLAESEQKLIAYGIGGTVEYVLRRIQFNINDFNFYAPVAWLQSRDNNEMILGREVVFDLFDITFKQADEKIIFIKRNNL